MTDELEYDDNYDDLHPTVIERMAIELEWDRHQHILREKYSRSPYPNERQKAGLAMGYSPLRVRIHEMVFHPKQYFLQR